MGSEMADCDILRRSVSILRSVVCRSELHPNMEAEEWQVIIYVVTQSKPESERVRTKPSIFLAYPVHSRTSETIKWRKALLATH
jgi:hypothetical protein